MDISIYIDILNSSLPVYRLLHFYTVMLAKIDNNKIPYLKKFNKSFFNLFFSWASIPSDDKNLRKITLSENLSGRTKFETW